MIVDPVFIIGTPRSGTSMLYQVLRIRHPFWSLPSEGQHIWNELCHPALNQWKSEQYYDTEVTDNQKEKIIKLYDQQSMPYWFWKTVNHSRIWQLERTESVKASRKRKGDLYFNVTKLFYYANPLRSKYPRRLMDKSVSNCLRLDLVDKIFPRARYIYIKREGIATISSLIRGWLTPGRFISFNPPDPIKIRGYDRPEWKFAMPEGWRSFDSRHLAEVCAWQWKTCHEKILEFRDKNRDRFLDIKLEEIRNEPERNFREIADFIDISQDVFCDIFKSGIPVVNESPRKTNDQFPFPVYLEKIREDIRPVMIEIGYE